eukprot:3974488-Pleurochrysis_carterae.AAC.1
MRSRYVDANGVAFEVRACDADSSACKQSRVIAHLRERTSERHKRDRGVRAAERQEGNKVGERATARERGRGRVRVR